MAREAMMRCLLDCDKSPTLIDALIRPLVEVLPCIDTDVIDVTSVHTFRSACGEVPGYNLGLTWKIKGRPGKWLTLWLWDDKACKQGSMNYISQPTENYDFHCKFDDFCAKFNAEAARARQH